MIIVNINREDSKIKGFSVKGHAGYRPPGEDIVCAAVSMLAQTTLLGLNRYAGEGLSYDIVDNPVLLKCSLTGGLSELQEVQCQAILETMVEGLKNLQKNYSGYVKVFRRRWTSC
ncbi:MAG TPA: ribosomal-processing cysteine protease Prp [Desulfobacteria bacterium]|nr:ribosomal-processing cysteine protease Prp [Desulfobacteria bacterium]